MSHLVAYYNDEPANLKGQVEIQQLPIGSAERARSADGVVRTSVVYLSQPSEAGQFLIPFGEYDDWSLRDRYNEAIRIMNTLGASSITCETYGEMSKRRRLGVSLPKRGSAALEQRRMENSGFDFRHNGAGSAPRDPRPLRWADEPGFAAAVSSVLENGATEIVINVKSSRSHAVDGALGTKLRKLGFELGGSTQRSGVTSLHIRAEFPQARKTWR
jgi:hypothetical protein